ncbi:MAG: hypothetical protein ACLFQZ_14090 [Spirochaetaceae bacterium]
MILSRVKRLLQSVEEASPLQVAVDLGVDRGMAVATLEHLCAMGKVVRRSPSSAAGTPGSGLGECGERIGCASCPLVRVCDSQSEAGTAAGPGATRLEEEVLYAWATN